MTAYPKVKCILSVKGHEKLLFIEKPILLLKDKGKTRFDLTRLDLFDLLYFVILSALLQVLLLLFAVLRRLAWDYGRIALVSRREEK